jgi:glycolate dehydrogenase FAD-binding subunit
MAAAAAGTRDAALARLIEAILEAQSARAALEIRGGGTKAFYGEMPHGRPLELGALAGITSYEPAELVVTARAGTRLDELEAALAERGQCLPFEPPRFAAGGTVGGMVAAGLAGPARAAAGGVRDHVLGASLVDGHGELQTFGGQVIKNVAGYDVARLLAGSWGILGPIVEVSLKVLGAPPVNATRRLDCGQAEALALLGAWAVRPWPLRASAWHADRLYLRFAGAAAAVETAAAACGGVALDPPDAQAWWDDLRDHRHAFFRIAPAALAQGEELWRLSLPANTAPPVAGGACLVEWGGALVWWRGVADAHALRAAVRAVGGHATLVRAAAKPGGAFERPAEPLMTIHRRLKQAFDPFGLFNLGRLYADL